MILRDLFIQSTGATVAQEGRVSRFTGFASDSREAMPGELFVAVRGMHADGHDFAASAVARGASGVVLEASFVSANLTVLETLQPLGACVLIVPDVRQALRSYATAVLRLWHPRVIAVSGSAGKTTTKEAIATILGQHASTFRSWRNYNDLLGMPLSLGGLEPHHEFAVIEIACDWSGEIAALAEIIQPEYGVLLNALATHLDGMGSIESVADALSVLPSLSQHVFVNGKDELLQARNSAYSNVTFFADADAPLQALPLDDAPYLRLRFTVNGSTWDADFRGLYGNHWHTCILAALTVADALDIPLREACDTLADLQPLPGRMRLLAGHQGARILDDSHSAIPEALSASLTTLDALGQRWHAPRIAILGDMNHLGHQAEMYHQEAGQQAARTVDWLITRGELGEMLARAAKAAGMPDERIIITHAAADASAAALDICADLPEPPVILIKGTSSLRMEQITAALLDDPQRDAEQLDRQRAIWKRQIVSELNRPTWLEIDLAAIGANTRAIAALIGHHVRLMATLKADGYGHGALKVAHTVLRNGAEWLGVATLSEAIPLREAGINAPMMVYGYLPPWQARQAVHYDLRVNVSAADVAMALSRSALALGQTAHVHVKIDTGMGRLGLRAEDPGAIVAFIRMLHELPGIEVEGVFTHFATADEKEQRYMLRQLERFECVLAALDANSLRPPIVHAANSAATLAFPQTHYNMVRPGIALYGLHPSPDVPLPAHFRPALSFKTQIAQITHVPAGEGISYGATYVTNSPEHIATLPVGYADGFRRGPINWGEVLVHGQRAPLRGRICMDQAMISVEHIPDARVGDEVVLIGEQGDDRITAEEVAQRLGTINYEVVSELLARVPRLNG
jgi:Alr-MurF fusion protein